MDKQVKISHTAHQTLTTLAAKKDRSLKDYLEQCILYFKVTELDPKEIDADGIKVELKKLDRRIVSFFRVQEKEKIGPIVDELAIISKSLADGLKISPSKKDFTDLSTIVKETINRLIENQKNVAGLMADTRVREVKEIKLKSRKLFQEYLVELESKSLVVSRKALDEKYVKLFENL